jgi:hypothetical protein
MISQRYVRKPRKEYRCTCGAKITGQHIYCYGGEEYGKPNGIRICQGCALDKENIIEEIYEFAVKHFDSDKE